jgi:hypothetical protein
MAKKTKKGDNANKTKRKYDMDSKIVKIPK